ncbi:MAG: hypothetical protein E7021_00355 [Alphaproteobacteria bacterium]|nr:hypothetical protein [Alphaproteobacteria bacterium]
MIIKILVFLWIFILPILSFLWEVFYGKTNPVPVLNSKGKKEFQKYFGISFIVSIFIFVTAYGLIYTNSISEFIEKIIIFFKQPLWVLCVVEIMYIDTFIAVTFEFLMGRHKEKKYFNWKWIKNNWPMIKASLPNMRILWYIHLLVVFLSVRNISDQESIFILLVYPITSYLYAKNVYAYYIFKNKGFCDLNSEETQSEQKFFLKGR